MNVNEHSDVILRHVGSAVIVADETGSVQYLNQAAERLTGWRLPQALGSPVEQVVRLFDKVTCEPLESRLTAAMGEDREISTDGPALLISGDGNEAYVDARQIALVSDDETLAGCFVVLDDVSESLELNRRLGYHARHDILTGLLSRREFQNRLASSLRDVARSDECAVLCHLDIDGFRNVNQSLGCNAGDALLGQIGALIRAGIRHQETLARLADNAFGLLLEGASIESAQQTARDLCASVRDFEFSWDQQSLNITISIGVVSVSPKYGDPDALLLAAEEACRAAKDQGGDTVHCA
ncbi:MAG: diguanylate cyclase domain-containing protein [Woeseia sp.]